jgi:2-polyprenyl-3-methyl-5-hydroxy-6-metoxy-1,4-benzoquinol methylase
MTLVFDKPSDLIDWTLKTSFGAEADAALAPYYQSFAKSFGPLRRHKYDLQLESLSALVKAGTVKSVLDVGCGCGSVSLWFSYLGASVKGIDLQEPRLRAGRKRAEVLGLSPTLALQSLFEETGRYDAIWIEQAFHHIEPRERAFEHLASLLNPGGYLVISESNAWNPLIQGALVKRRGFKTVITMTDDAGTTHMYGNERITIPSVLTRGFAKHKIQHTGRRFFGVLPNSKRFEPLRFLDDHTPQLMVPLFTHYLWLGRKALADEGPIGEARVGDA